MMHESKGQRIGKAPSLCLIIQNIQIIHINIILFNVHHFTNYTNYTGKFKNILKIDNILYNLICINTIYFIHVYNI